MDIMTPTVILFGAFALLFWHWNGSSSVKAEDVDVQVIVIGAGMAGISAAHQLKERGVQVKILEARDRIGGRIYSFKDGGDWLEMGA